MAQERRRLAFLTRDDLQKIQAQLRKIAESKNPDPLIPEKITRPYLVRALRREIAAMLRQGYAVEHVLAVLNEYGMPMDSKHFKDYWRAVTRQKNARSIESE